MIAVDKIFLLVHDESKQRDDLSKLISSLPWKVPVQKVKLESALNDNHHEDGLKRHLVWAGPVTDDIAPVKTHFSVWQMALKEELSSILVLEDDVQLVKTHFHVLETEEPWDLMYLGRESFSADEPVDGGLVVPGFSDGTFAYVLRHSGLTKLVKSGLNEDWTPLQDFFGAMQGVHHDPVLSARFKPTLHVLAPMSNFVERGKDTTPATSSAGYKPLHQTLFEYDHPDWIKSYINPQLIDREFDLICDEPIPNVYTFPLFSVRFCSEIIEEAEHYGQWTNYRYQNDSTHASIDLMLESIGFHEIYKDVLRRYLHPLFQHKYQLNPVISDTLESQHFVVRYMAEEQRHLGLHNDACDIAMIVTLNTDFEGGGTFFPKFGKLIKHDLPGYASIHPGFVGYTHGARPITRGRRYILASFFFRK